MTKVHDGTVFLRTKALMLDDTNFIKFVIKPEILISHKDKMSHTMS